MFYIRQLECIYCDVSNQNRSTDRDVVKDIETFRAKTSDEAREIVLQVLGRVGGIERLGPKILARNAENMWIECDRPTRETKNQGLVDVFVLAFEITFREKYEDNIAGRQSLNNFALSLGPSFSL